MDKNTLIGILLIGVIFIAFMFVNQQEQEAIKQAQTIETQSDSVSVNNETGNDKKDSSFIQQPKESLSVLTNDEDSTLSNNTLTEQEIASRKQKFGCFYPSFEGEKEYFFLENEKIRIKLSNLGARIVEASIVEKDAQGDFLYKTHSDFVEDVNNPIQLFEEETSNQELIFSVKDRYGDLVPVSSKKLFFDIVSSSDSSVVFKLKSDNPEESIFLKYNLPSNSYHVNYSIDYSQVEKKVDLGRTKLNWSQKGLSTEKLADDERMTCSVMFRYADEGRDYISERSDDLENIDGKLDWVAFKYKFFSSILLTDGGVYSGEVSQVQLEDEDYTIIYNSSLNIPYPEYTTTNLKFFFGPNKYELLSSYDLAMDQIINLGWGIFRWVNNLMIEPIFNLLKKTGFSFGIIILLVTLFVKLIILPLTYKNYKSSAKMRVLKPEIDKINKKYEGKTEKDAMVKKQQETMGLYRKTGVNPMSGCIPMIIQMPILLAVFRFFPSSIDLRHKGFLWAEDLSSYDAIVSWATEIPLLSSFYGNHVSLFTLLMAASTMLYTMMNSSQMANTSQPGMPNMKVIMYIFPVMMLFFFNTYSSGLSYYYLCGNLMNLAIMWAIKKYMIDEDKIRLQIETNKKKPKKKSKFQQRMEEITKQQQKRR